MKPEWVMKNHPKHHPVRFLAFLWQQRLAKNFGITGKQFTPKEFGQLKSLKKALGNFTTHVVEWMLQPANWWHFCQQVRSEAKLHYVPDYPEIGFLLWQHGRALRIMRWKLRDSQAPADISFCTKLDQLHYERWKDLVLVYAEGKPERLAQIDKAKTLIDIQQVFIQLVDENTASRQPTGS